MDNILLVFRPKLHCFVYASGGLCPPYGLFKLQMLSRFFKVQDFRRCFLHIPNVFSRFRIFSRSRMEWGVVVIEVG